MNYDYHVHTTYSDGAEPSAMIEAAAQVGLDGVGLADHCNVSREEPGVSRPYDLDETYPDRRREIEEWQGTVDVQVFDAVEMDYRPADEARIEAFLAEAAFEYVIGSVHHVGEREVMSPGAFVDEPEDDRAAFVDRYFDRVVDLIRSELFDVVAHVDVTERNPHLRGQATDDHYRQVADALATSRTVPEINAGRAFRGYSQVHPHPDFLDVLQSADVDFVAGTDAHLPEELRERTAYLERVLADRGIETLQPSALAASADR